MIEQLADWIQTRNELEIFHIIGYIVALILFTAIMLFIWFDTAPPEEKKGPTLQDHQAEDDFASFQKMLMGKNAHTGETTRYSWMQNEHDLDIFIPISETTEKKNVQVKTTTSHVKIVIDGMVALDDDFEAPVVPDDCFWQLDESKKQKVLWLSFSKKKPEIWKFIFMADAPSADEEIGNFAESDLLLPRFRKPTTGASSQP